MTRFTAEVCTFSRAQSKNKEEYGIAVSTGDTLQIVVDVDGKVVKPDDMWELQRRPHLGQTHFITPPEALLSKDPIEN